jgi:hypothetical protein
VIFVANLIAIFKKSSFFSFMQHAKTTRQQKQVCVDWCVKIDEKRSTHLALLFTGKTCFTKLQKSFLGDLFG